MARYTQEYERMGYKDPAKVVAPKTRWELTKVLCNTGQSGWSAAVGIWDGTPDTLAIRWNGDDDTGSPGNPQSHGNPTWFIVPGEMDQAVRGVAYDLDEKMSFITYDVKRPENFDYGVYRVTITIKGKVLKAVSDSNIVFTIPELPKRFFRQSQEYMVAPSEPGAPWGGRFLNGVWEGIVQTNGISEDENPTHMDVVAHALIANVMKALKPWEPSKTVDKTTHHPMA